MVVVVVEAAAVVVAVVGRWGRGWVVVGFCLGEVV